MIEVRGLTKRYGDTTAVDELTFEVWPGSVTGFLGPNGSGKSTTMRLILGLDHATAGGAWVNGRRYAELSWPLREVGSLLEARACHPGRSAFDHLLALAMANAISRSRVREVLELVGLARVAGQRAGSFSLGMSQRLGLAAALLGDPGVLLLDEPVNGLDPEGIHWIRGLLKQLAAQGRTVFVSSHLISEMAITAGRLVVIGAGRLLADTSVAQLSARSTSLEQAFLELTAGSAEYRAAPNRDRSDDVPGRGPGPDLSDGGEDAVTTIQRSGAARGRYGFPNVTRMEWVKLRSLRSTWWTLAVSAVGAVGIAVAVGANTKDASSDLTNNALAGIAPGLLLTGLMGVLAMTSEYSSGTIRPTFAATPNRRLLLAAKAAVFGAVALSVGEATSFLAFLAGGAALPDAIPAPALGQPGVLRALVLAGAGFCLIGLIGLGLGAVIRHTPAAIAVLIGGVYVAAQMLGGLSETAAGYVPVSIVANSLSTVQPLEGMPSPWNGLAVLCLYAAIALSIGGWLLMRRDA